MKEEEFEVGTSLEMHLVRESKLPKMESGAGQIILYGDRGLGQRGNYCRKIVSCKACLPPGKRGNVRDKQRIKVMKIKTKAIKQQHVIPTKGTKARNWYAWLNTMPPKPDDLHVTGEVLVGNPGVYALLYKKEPQGINPSILLLDLHLVQRPGIWPQVLSWVPARYDEVITGTAATQVHIFSGATIISKMDVEVIS